MEHILNFAVNIEDEKIVDTIMNSGVQQIEKELKQAVINKIFDNGFSAGWGRRGSENATVNDPLSSWTRHVVEEFLDENKDAIIDAAAGYLAEKLSRTKAAKELIGKAAQ